MGIGNRDHGSDRFVTDVFISTPLHPVPATSRLPPASPCAHFHKGGPWFPNQPTQHLQRHHLHWLWKAQQTWPGRAPAGGLGCNPGGSAEAAEEKTFRSIIWTALLQDLWWKLVVFLHEQPELCSLCFNPALREITQDIPLAQLPKTWFCTETSTASLSV